MNNKSASAVLAAVLLLTGCSSGDNGSNSTDTALLDDETASSLNDDVADDDGTADESPAEAGNTEDATEEGSLSDANTDEISAPFAIAHVYRSGAFTVTWQAPGAGLEAMEFEITLNGEVLDSSDIVNMPGTDRYGYTLDEIDLGRSVFDIRTVMGKRRSKPTLQWLFNDPGRDRRDSNLRIAGELIDRQFFEFPVRTISTIDNENLIALALLMMNALQVTITPRTEALAVFLDGLSISDQTNLPVGEAMIGIGSSRTTVHLCENAGRSASNEFRAGSVTREFDQRVYNDCALNGKVTDGWFEQTVFTTDGTAPGVVFDERYTLDTSMLSISEGTVIGQFLLSAFAEPTVSLLVTIDDPFVEQPNGFYTSGVMTAVASDGSTLSIDATTDDVRTVSYSGVNGEVFVSGTLPWPKSDLPSPPANVSVELANGIATALIWPGATDDQAATLSFEVKRDGIEIAAVTEQNRDFVSARRTNFDAGYFRYPAPFSTEPLLSGVYTIVSVDSEGNRSDPFQLRVE